MLSQPIENIVKEVENMKSNRIEISWLKNITKMYNSLEDFLKDLKRQKKESAIIKIGHLKISSQRRRKKNRIKKNECSQRFVGHCQEHQYMQNWSQERERKRQNKN